MSVRRHKKARWVLSVCDVSRLNGYDCNVRPSYVFRWARPGSLRRR